MDVFDPGGFFGLGGIIQRSVAGLQGFFVNHNIHNPWDAFLWFLGALSAAAWGAVVMWVEKLPEHLHLAGPDVNLYVKFMLSFAMFNRVLPMELFFGCLTVSFTIQSFIWIFRFWRFLKSINPFAAGS